MKTAKRLLRENLAPNGDLNIDSAARALLQYRNTQLQEIGLSPAQLLYSRRLRDHLPSFADALKFRPEWTQLAEDRERALAKRPLRERENYKKHTRQLPDLEVGELVLVQNQSGIHPPRWDKTGQVVQRPHDQYINGMDGSGRCSVRNRRFLHHCLPFMSDRKLHIPAIDNQSAPLSQSCQDSSPSCTMPPPDEPINPPLEQVDIDTVRPNEHETETSTSINPDFTQISHPIQDSAPMSPVPCCSGRRRRPPQRLSLRMHRQTHSEELSVHPPFAIKSSDTGEGGHV